MSITRANTSEARGESESPAVQGVRTFVFVETALQICFQLDYSSTVTFNAHQVYMHALRASYGVSEQLLATHLRAGGVHVEVRA